MSVFKNLKRICSITSFLIVFCIPINSNAEIEDVEQHNEVRIFIKTHDRGDSRRIIWQFSNQIDNRDIPTPILQQTPSNGTFNITMQNIATCRFFGPLEFADQSGHPLQYTISFPDSFKIVLEGKTLPFSRVASCYLYEAHCIVFDIYYTKCSSSYWHNPDNFPPYNNTYATTIIEQPLSGVKKSKIYYLSRALPIAAVIFLFIMSLFLIIYHYLSKKNSIADNQNNKIQLAKEFLQINFAKIKEKISEETIKKISIDKNISYDEASLLLNLIEERNDAKV